MNEFQQKCVDFLSDQTFDSLALGVIDFSANSFDSFQISEMGDEPLYFDLASLTKPLSLGLYFLLNQQTFTSEMKLLLNHSAGIPSWGKLSKKNWREVILSYPIQKSETEYSDFSALRLMLEIEKSGDSLKESCSSYWDKELLFWKDLPVNSFSPVTGTRNGSDIMGEVNDDNAYVIGEFCSHAGLFSTIEGVCQTLLNINKKCSLLKSVEAIWNEQGRFVGGWDRVQDRQKTLAGSLCGEKTFGHLGFTGTSIWIDIGKKRGFVFLTNATQKFWYDREKLNRFRREIGNSVWSK